MTSTPTRHVDNVVITTKGLQDRNINILDGTTVENKGKLILIAMCCLLAAYLNYCELSTVNLTYIANILVFRICKKDDMV